MDPSGPDPAAFSDIRLCGYLRKQKSHRRRYFVLRCGSERGPARLEYYENEKKFRTGGPCPRPKRVFPLASALNVNKRADARHRYLIVLYGRDGTFGVAAENAEQQQTWYTAMMELRRKGQESSGGDPHALGPGLAFQEVWQVSLRPRGLGQSRNLTGVYLLGLTERTISFMRLNSDVAAVVLQLLNVRRCGHSENYFFMEVGRSAATGPGELWMQVEDLVVAQNMHETILEAMKALRSKGQALASTPISVPPRRQHPATPPPSQGSFSWKSRAEGMPFLNKSPRATTGQKPPATRKPDSLSDYSAISSDEGGSSPCESRPPSTLDPLSYMVAGGELDYISMSKLASPDGHRLAQWVSGAEPNKRASLPPMALEKDTPSLPRRTQSFKAVAVSASYPEGLNLHGTDPGYMAMLPGVATSTEDQDYVPMTPSSVSPPQESGGYMLMSPSGSCSPDGTGHWAPAGDGTEGKSFGGNYMNMSPASLSASSTSPEHSPLLAISGSAPFYSLPRSYKHTPKTLLCPFNSGRFSGSSSTSSESLEGSLGGLSCPLNAFMELPPGGRGAPSAPRSAGEYVSIEYPSRGTDYISMELCATPAESSGTAVPDSYAEMAPGAQLMRVCPQGMRRNCSETFPETERYAALPPPPLPSSETQMELGLNYIDLDLAKEVANATPAEVANPVPLHPYTAPDQVGPLHAYASIDFHRSGEFRGYRANSEGDGKSRNLTCARRKTVSQRRQ
ncbi:insulin receptor substrate 1-like isoform X2 [Sceloporus undulatus]|uniref:insulin receptor substrate 1-like isoform X2 n=1 Tax=Sceloporus undulatus TaxID=8520 RepID=UPI001C4B7C24|nr:insulin receptor substrate 1-like isoform X2 [Sceloporus undulatus]